MENDKNTAFTLWLEFEECLPEPGSDIDIEDDFFNMKITLESGKSYALNVWTFKFLERYIHAIRFENPVPEELRQVGCMADQHPLQREYLEAPDLFVSRLDRKLIEEIVAHMLKRWDGRLLPEWECPPPLDPEDEGE